MFCLIAPTGVATGSAPVAGPLLRQRLRGALELPPVGGDDSDLHTPFERCQSLLRAGPAQGALPLAAWRLQAAGIEPGRLPWALVSPLHLQLEAAQAVALPPAALQLEEAEADAFWALLMPFLLPFSEGWQHHRLDALHWAVGHEQLDGLQLASLERACDRSLSPWLPTERWLRRVTNEAQMLLHEHPLNLARQAAGKLPLNSLWWWGAGRAQGEALPSQAQLLRPLDWQQADALLPAESISHTLWLAGDRQARSFRIERPLSLQGRWRQWRDGLQHADAVLASL